MIHIDTFMYDNYDVITHLNNISHHFNILIQDIVIYIYIYIYIVMVIYIYIYIYIYS